MGELFDEFRVRIPPHEAIRRWRAVYKRDDETIPDTDRAQWLLFCQTLRNIGTEREPSTTDHKHRKIDWSYNDRIRLKPIPNVTCLKCGGHLVKVRYSHGKVECLTCLNAPTAQPVEMEQPKPTSPQEVAEALKDQLRKSYGLVYGPQLKIIEQPNDIEVIDRREVARWIKHLAPFSGFSINFIERQMRSCQDDVDTTLIKLFGLENSRNYRRAWKNIFQSLINRRRNSRNLNG
jgi:hypothetical protein